MGCQRLCAARRQGHAPHPHPRPLPHPRLLVAWDKRSGWCCNFFPAAAAGTSLTARTRTGIWQVGAAAADVGVSADLSICRRPPRLGCWVWSRASPASGQPRVPGGWLAGWPAGQRVPHFPAPAACCRGGLPAGLQSCSSPKGAAPAQAACRPCCCCCLRRLVLHCTAALVVVLPLVPAPAAAAAAVAGASPLLLPAAAPTQPSVADSSPPLLCCR